MTNMASDLNKKQYFPLCATLTCQMPAQHIWPDFSCKNWITTPKEWWVSQLFVFHLQRHEALQCILWSWDTQYHRDSISVKLACQFCPKNLSIVMKLDLHRYLQAHVVNTIVWQHYVKYPFWDGPFIKGYDLFCLTRQQWLYCLSKPPDCLYKITVISHRCLDQ